MILRLKTFFIQTVLFTIITEVYAQNKIFGYVIEITTGLPVENAVVFVNDEQNIPINPIIRDTTDALGYYEFDVDYGVYHFGVYAPYEINEESYLMVFIPGIFNILGDGSEYLSRFGLRTDFGISEAHFKFLFEFPNLDTVTFSEDPDDKLRMFFDARKQLSQSKVRTFGEPYFTQKPISYIEKYNW